MTTPTPADGEAAVAGCPPDDPGRAFVARLSSPIGALLAVDRDAGHALPRPIEEVQHDD